MKKKTSKLSLQKKKSTSEVENKYSEDKHQLERKHIQNQINQTKEEVQLERVHEDKMEFYKGGSDLMHYHQKKVDKQYQLDKKEFKSKETAENVEFTEEMMQLTQNFEKKKSDEGQIKPVKSKTKKKA